MDKHKLEEIFPFPDFQEINLKNKSNLKSIVFIYHIFFVFK